MVPDSVENENVGIQKVSKQKIPKASSTEGRLPPIQIVTFTPFDIFQKCIERAKNLLKIHEAAHGKKSKPDKFLADAHRAAVVLTISALDAFIRTFVIERIRGIIADKKKDIPTELSNKIKSFLKDDGLLEAARKDDLLERVEKAFRGDFERKSFQGTKAIEECFKMIGYSKVFNDLSIELNINEETLREKFNEYTQRRHDIAHSGDYDLNQRPPLEQQISKKYAQDCIKLFEKIASHIKKLGGAK